ncbi:MAG TPA: outer membrane beta-barrel protein [Candidatus Angelobacter sp.]
MKNAMFVLLVLFGFSLPLLGQHDIEFNGGYQHISGDGGLDGFTIGAALVPIRNFQLYINYDGVFDHSTVGAFALTSIGLTTINSHMQGFLTGPRFFLPGLIQGKGRVKGHLLLPFIDAGFGVMHLHSDLTAQNLGSQSASDTAFAWALGGGADYRVHPHFTLRGNIGLERTHFANSGQSRIRLGATVVWSIRSRAQ